MRQAKFGCEYNASMWHNQRLSLTLGVDATDAQQLSAALPAEPLDLIVDDGSHRFGDQQGTLHTTWPRLRPGGFYIVEDLLVGPLPWSPEHAQQVPTNNTGCGGECYFPQRPAEHPWLFDRFGVNRHQDARTPLSKQTRALLNANDWFCVLTGVHRGGGVDAALVLRKAGPPLPTAPALDAMRERMGGKIPEKAAYVVGCQAIQRLKDVHAKGLVHRDVKPQNFCVLDGTVYDLVSSGNIASCDGGGPSTHPSPPLS